MLVRSRITTLTSALALLSLVLLLGYHARQRYASAADWEFQAPISLAPSANESLNAVSAEGNAKTSPDTRVGSCSSDWGLLSRLNIPSTFRYARRDVVVRPNSELQRASLTKVDAPLFPEFQTIDKSNDSDLKLKHCMQPLILDVPLSPLSSVDASNIIFGTSTNLERLNASIPFFQRWLAYTHAKLFVVLTGPNESAPDTKEMKRLESYMRRHGLNVTLVKPLRRKDSPPERYFSLAKIMYDHRDEHTQWISFIDDDTFINSMPSLLSKLDTYDTNQQHYIGALSEEWWTVGRYGLMGMGGAGVFLSIALAGVLDANYDDCKSRSGSGAGDVRLMECITWHSSNELTHVPGLHQIDLHGDRSGLFESGRPILSIHHWKEGWWDVDGMGLDGINHGTWFPMAAMHLVADICGTCFLQRWQFGSDMILSNGYSIATYPNHILTKFDKDMGLERVEHTWLTPAIIEGSVNEGFDHYLGPLRPMLKLEEEKVQYRFLDAVAVDGGVRQFYLHLGLEGNLDTLVELFWRREGTGP